MKNPTHIHPLGVTYPEPSEDAPARSFRSSPTFDWIMAALSGWVIAGLFLDGWYHNAFSDSIETFFTPWHAVLYSGLLVSSLALGLRMLQNLRQGATWRQALSGPYMISALGCLIFAAGGGIDLAWHSLFGFEADVEALLSPAHMILAAGGLLLVSGPLRAHLARDNHRARSAVQEVLPPLLSLLFMLSIFTFFTQFSNLYAHPSLVSEAAPAGGYYRYLWNVTVLSYVLVPATITVAFVLYAIKNMILPVGSLTLVLVANALLMFALGAGRGESRYWPVILAALLGGLAAEIGLAYWKRFPARPTGIRLLAFAQPFVTALVYFLLLIGLGGIDWRIHMWLGAPLLAGVLGLGLSYLVLPGPAETHEGKGLRDNL